MQNLNGKPFNIEKTDKLKKFQDRHSKSITSINLFQ